MDETGSGSCSLATSGISRIEDPDYATILPVVDYKLSF